MLKSIGLLTVLAAAVASAAFMPAGDEPQACPAGKCGAATAESGKQCGQCPATTATSQDATTACTDGKCAGGACASCADGKSCAVATSAKQGEGATCSAGACGSTACGSDCKDCPITAAMKQLPQMTYQVGTEKSNCPKAAAELAKNSDAAIQYVVADKTFASEGEAKLALAESTEQFVSAYVEPKVCKESGNITVAGHKACCGGTAAQMSKVAKEAMDKVQLTYLVGEKSCHCPVEAEKLATDSGDVTILCVGEEKTACKVTARLNLVRAKYKAAVVALMQAETTTKPTSQDQQGS